MIVFLLLVFLPVAVWACPLCKEAFTSSPDAAFRWRAELGYWAGLATLLGVPALLVVGIGWKIARATRTRSIAGSASCDTSSPPRQSAGPPARSLR